MRGSYIISFLLLFGSNLQLSGQDALSKSEKSFAKIRVEKGTRDVTLTSDYGKKWKMRVNFPENGEEKKALIIALHWAGGGKTYKEFNDCLALPALETLNAIIVSPESENQRWSTANNVEKILFIIANAKKYWNINPQKIAVTGYSNGGNGSWFFAENYPELFSAAIPIAGLYAINKKIEIPLYVIHGAKDELFKVGKTTQYINNTQNAGSDVTFIINEELSHYNGCSYIADLKNAGKWLEAIWSEK